MIRRLPAVGVLAIGCLLAPLTAHAADYPVTTLTFGVATFNLGAEALTFATNPVTTETASTIEVSLPADVLFDFDKSEIRPDARQPLHEVAQIIQTKGHGRVSIQGYTDALGTDAYNQRLSERRAASVRQWLITHEGLPAVQLTTRGYGSRDPVAPNRNPNGSDNPAGRQMNRRVTFVIPR